MRILVVEDGPKKATALRALLCKSVGISDDALKIVTDIVTAKAELVETAYDVLFLDLALPNRFGEEVVQTGGGDLLRHIISSSKVKRPKYIVGLTEYEDSARAAGPLFAEHLYGLITVEVGSDAWLEKVAHVVTHAKLAARISEDTCKDICDVAIVCALRDPELDELIKLNNGWAHQLNEDLGLDVHTLNLETATGVASVIATYCPQMGMAAAAATATKVIEAYRPRYIGMTGIAGGNPNVTSCGDVLVVDPSWDYTSGKRKRNENGEMVFEQDQRQLRMDPLLKLQFDSLAADKNSLSKIRDEWCGDHSDFALRVHCGPVATGGAVVDDAEFWKEVSSYSRKVVGVDMETYGLYCAAAFASSPQPKVFAVKSVSDHAASKTDAFRRYAAYTSARFTMNWIHRYVRRV